jgi:hypothetical protein
MDHMVDSYEIYGEDQPDDSENEEQEELVHVGRQRGVNQKTNAARAPRGNQGSKNRRGNEEFLDGIGEIMIDEQVLEPSKMMKNENYGNKSRSTSNQPGSRKQGSHPRDKRDRESSGVKKTQIEVLDHETPIEEYQQYYQQNLEDHLAP